MEMKILISLHVTYEVKPSLNGLFNFFLTVAVHKRVLFFFRVFHGWALQRVEWMCTSSEKEFVHNKFPL